MRVREKRNLVAGRSIAAAVALAVMVLVCLPSGALAALFLAKHEGTRGDKIEYSLSAGQPGDAYTIKIGDKELASGVDDTGDGIRDNFTIPDLGDSELTVTIEATVTRAGEDPIVSDRTFHYLAPAAAGGTTGSAQQQGSGTTSGPISKAVPTAPAKSGATGKGSPSKGTTGGTKKQGSKKKSGSNDSPAYVAPRVNSGGSIRNATGRHTSVPSTPFKGFNLPSAPALPPASIPPPGIAGNGGIVGTPPPAPAPAAGPVATGGGHHTNFDVPAWLVVLLGALTFGALGGAEARLLGLWGTPIATASSPDETRLLALTRAAQSGATTQQAIAARKGVRTNGAAGKSTASNGAPADGGSKLKV
jgi:hypothetical protein